MRTVGDALLLAASDLSNYLACQHGAGLDLAAAVGKLGTPETRLDAATRLLRERGEAHERA